MGTCCQAVGWSDHVVNFNGSTGRSSLSVAKCDGIVRGPVRGSDRADYVTIVNNEQSSESPAAFLLQSCSDSLFLTTFQMLYKLNHRKRKVKVLPASASYVETPAIINDCNVDRIMSEGPPSNLCHTGLTAAQRGLKTCDV